MIERSVKRGIAGRDRRGDNTRFCRPWLSASRLSPRRFSFPPGRPAGASVFPPFFLRRRVLPPVGRAAFFWVRPAPAGRARRRPLLWLDPPPKYPPSKVSCPVQL